MTDHDDELFDELDRRAGRQKSGSSTDEELPADPDLDDLPPEVRERPGPFTISGVDPETGERYEGPVSRDDLARGFADARRRREDSAS